MLKPILIGVLLCLGLILSANAFETSPYIAEIENQVSKGGVLLCEDEFEAWFDYKTVTVVVYNRGETHPLVKTYTKGVR